MAAPPKPWERIGVNANNLNFPQENQLINAATGYILPQDRNSGLQGGTYPNRKPQYPMSNSGNQPPPLPPRPNSAAPTAMNTYGTGLGGYSPYSSMYGGGYGGMYGGYGGGMYGYNRLGGAFANPNMGGYSQDPNFWQIAEENSRQAFQSIESIVQAFGSVSMMLESTFTAVYSSFRAVIGVADHFTRLKIHLTQMISALAIFRTVRWMYRRLLYLLGIRNLDINSEEAWSNATQQLETSGILTEADLKKTRSSWPIIMFFGVVLGTPWLIWRILQSVTSMGAKEAAKWMTGEDDHFVAVAQYDFSTKNERELPFRAGQEIKLAPKDLQPQTSGWLLASVNGKKIGLVPANYIQILGKRRGTKHVQVSAVPETQTQVASDQQMEQVFCESNSTSTSSTPSIAESNQSE